MFARMISLFRDELGNSLIEYALILGLIAITGLFSARMLGPTIKAQLHHTDTLISAAISAKN
jgi:Flp pilus assembly pilin Flp